MGKGFIISGGEAGRYVVKIDYDDTRKALIIARLDEKIAFYQAQLALETDSHRQARLRLWIAAAQKRRDFLSAPSVCPTDGNVTAWCADLTEDLSGNVGTIEIESVPDQVLIRPGYEGNAVYSALRDGQLIALLAQDSASSVFNWIFHDARQKWAPRHRVGEITSVDHDTDTCSLTIDAAAGAMTGIDINRETSFSSVPIDYMSCDSAPFEAGDRVVVEFTENDWTQPVVIGFEANPKGCDHDYVIIKSSPRPWDVDTNTRYTPDDWCIVWDVGMGCMAGEIEASSTPGDFLTFPCKYSDLAYWLSITETRASSSSISSSEFSDWTDWSWWEANPGEAAFPDPAGALCNGMLYSFWELSDFNWKIYRQDKFHLSSLTNAGVSKCLTRTQWFGWRDDGTRMDGKQYPGTPRYNMGWMEMESPLGPFEDFVHDCEFRVYQVDERGGVTVANFVPKPSYSGSPYWVGDGRPSLSMTAVYSGNSHLQIHVHRCQIDRIDNISGNAFDGWTVDERKATKLQIHAAASYHPDPDKTGAINVSPFALSRHAAFENAILDLLETQLKEEDATHGQDWSYWALDEDHDPAWPGPGTTAFFDSGCSETYQIPVLYSLTFGIEFREYPEAGE